MSQAEPLEFDQTMRTVYFQAVSVVGLYFSVVVVAAAAAPEAELEQYVADFAWRRQASMEATRTLLAHCCVHSQDEDR